MNHHLNKSMFSIVSLSEIMSLIFMKTLILLLKVLANADYAA